MGQFQFLGHDFRQLLDGHLHFEDMFSRL
jgi:hypothetical protein